MLRKTAIYATLIASALVLSLNACAQNNNNKTASTKVERYTDIDKKAASLAHKAPGLDPKVMKLALTAYSNAHKMGISSKPILTVIDYHQPNYQKRLYVFDVQKNRLLYNTYVAHGQKSGDVYAHYFSNKNGTHASSIGLYLTQNSYYGSKGLALRLNGLDRGYNDSALKRAIVIHGAWYVQPRFAEQTKHIGRSWGCPSVSQAMARPIINAIKNGTLVFAYAPNSGWLHSSRFLHGMA
jgi:hypothetical protein